MIGEALRRVRGRLTLDELALRMSVHKNTLGNYERGERLPDIDFLAVFAAATGADLGELLALRLEAGRRGLQERSAPGGAAGAIRERLAEPAADYRVSRDELVVVPSARNGPVPADMAFRRAWLEGQGLDPVALLGITAEDDSMAPTIRQGALVLVDARAVPLGGDGIHAIEYAGRLRIRRLQSDLEGGLFIRCDNPVFREIFLSGEALAGLRLVGRAVWSGGLL